MLETGREELASQNLDEAMDISVKALDIAEEYGYAELKAEVFCAMAHIDVAASHDGLTIKEIASKLNLSDRTVGNHRTHIFEKMDVSNVSEMIKKASEYGII